MISKEQFEKVVLYGLKDGITQEQVQEYVDGNKTTKEPGSLMTKTQRNTILKLAIPTVALTMGALIFPADAIAILILLIFLGFGVMVTIAATRRGLKTEAALDKIAEE